MTFQVKILAPFNDVDAKFLTEVDRACRAVMAAMEEEANKTALSGEQNMKLDMETIAWLKFIRGFGLLYNRAVDCGWLQGIVTALPPKEMFDDKT